MRLVGGDWGTIGGVLRMCDYSLQHVKSRSAKVCETLRTHHFNSGTIGFAAPEDANTAVCVLPGTELAFATQVRCTQLAWFGWKVKPLPHTTAIFRQVNKDNPRTHHDALEFPDGKMVLLTICRKVRKQRCFNFRRNLSRRQKPKPKNGFRTSDFPDLPLRALAALDQGEESKRAGGEARG